jgi:hypothetical protein
LLRQGITGGRKEWWVKVKDPPGAAGWTKVEDRG